MGTHIEEGQSQGRRDYKESDSKEDKGRVSVHPRFRVRGIVVEDECSVPLHDEDA